MDVSAKLCRKTLARDVFDRKQAVRLGGRHNMPPPLLTVGQFRANLWSGGKNCPQPMCVPNLKIVAFSVCEILRGPKISKLGHIPQATPT